MTRPIKAWLLDLALLDEAIPAQWLEHLSAAEQQRANTFKHAARRNSYIASHTIAYWALQQSFGAAIENYAIASEGVPLLIGKHMPTQAPTKLSLSHSGNYILCAISDAGTLIGCDIETHKARTNALAIAQQFFADNEYQQLQKLADSNETDKLEKLFYRMWTCKEAWLKAQGLGIANGLKKLAIEQNSFSFHNTAEARHHWQIALHETATYTLAIATGSDSGETFTADAIIEQIAWSDGQFQTTTIQATAKISLA